MIRRRQIRLAFAILLAISRELDGAGFVPSQISDTWTSFAPDSKDRPFFVYGICAIVEHEGWLWFGTEGHGLWRYHDGGFEDLSEYIHARNVRAILNGNDDSLWFCYDRWGGHGAADEPTSKEGVARYYKGEWRQYDMPDLIPGYAISLNQVFQTKDNALWFFSMGRLIKFKNGTWTLVPKVSHPHHFLEATDGTVWVTGEEGEHIWKSAEGDRFEAVTGSDGIGFQYPNYLAQTPDGTIWIGDYGLTTYKNGKFGRIEAKPTFDDGRIWPRFVSRDGTLFVAKWSGGLYPYRDGKWITGEGKDWPLGGPLIETRDGKVWYGVGSWSGRELGIANYANGVWGRFIDIAPNVVPDVESLHEGTDGSIWAGIKTGYMARYSRGEWRLIPRKPPQSLNETSESVSAWCNASDGSLWVGMKNGELRRFLGSKATLKLTKADNGASLGLTISRGQKDPTKWSIRYGFSASEKTLPSEFFQGQFGSKGEIAVAVPASNQKTFLHAFAIDVDGTAVELSDEGRFGAIVISEGSWDLPELPIPAGAITHIDGKTVPQGSVEFRGSVEDFAQAFYQDLADGFHSVQLKVETGVLRLSIYKEKQMLKAFRPFGRSVAIVIAVSNYPAASGYRVLPKAEEQARQLLEYLRSQDFEIVPLLGPKATKTNIINAINQTNVGPDDRLMIYFGGHGDARSINQDYVGYIVPFDGDKASLEKTGISFSDIIEQYSKSLRARQIMYVFDSCQSGLAVKRGNDIDPDPLRTQVKAYEDIKYYAQKGRMILTAGEEGEAAIDVNGGIFSRALLDGIRGSADREVGDKNGVVDFYELFSFIRREVTKEASNRGFLQHPDFSTSGGVGRFFFVTDRSLLK